MEKLDIPSDKELELVVLGSMLYSINCVNLGIPLLKDLDFYFSENRIIFQVLKCLYAKGKEIDEYVVSTELSSQNLLDQIGGIPKLNMLSQLGKISTSFEYNIEKLIELSKLRNLIFISKDLLDACAGKKVEANQIIIDLQKRLFETQGNSLHPPRSIRDVFSDFLINMTFEEYILYMMDRKAQGLPAFNGISSGYSRLDEALGTFINGALIYVGARTHMGKTTFMLNTIHNINHKDPSIPIGIFSLEMQDPDVTAKLLHLKANLPIKMYYDMSYDKENLENIFSSSEKLKHAPIFIESQSGLKISQLCSRARRMVQNFGIKIIFIDYLTLIKGDNSYSSKHLEISDVSKSLQALAKELNIPIVCLAQLNRNVINRTNPSPTLGDFRESGSIEEDADVCLLLHRPEYYDHLDKPGIMQVIIAKNRLRGQICKIEFSCDKEISERLYECDFLKKMHTSDFARPPLEEKEEPYKSSY